MKVVIQCNFGNRYISYHQVHHRFWHIMVLRVTPEPCEGRFTLLANAAMKRRIGCHCKSWSIANCSVTALTAYAPVVFFLSAIELDISWHVSENANRNTTRATTPITNQYQIQLTLFILFTELNPCKPNINKKKCY